ncbi:AfsR/SARP family transcriptional regulator [Nocardia transvalensis]|uniref:AfsR/SARP family transcriptional regulator n=1 Tax=Nocardia transvalensis TaxID=37333 RepID=UPI001893B562|nr:BTAD domain-containing putative transcriptional regulator [Nocardia transvalensis]MBF6333730.1 winged helix-turn-helix domain-containing protein [Nocardia transvalensis]
MVEEAPDVAGPMTLRPVAYDCDGMFPEHSGSAGAGRTNARPGGGDGPAAAAPVRVALLGEVAVRRDGELAAVPGARARLLIAALATHPGRSRSAQSLIDDVWGAQPPRAPMNALHTQVSRLRSALPDGVLEIGPAGYRLSLGEEQVDLTLARRLERQARELHAAGDDPGCLALVARARSLWRGEPGADLPPGPVADELAESAATRWRALDELELASREAAGDYTGAVTIARGIASAEPLDEPAHATLMRLLAAAGRGNEALDVFAGLRARLATELGTDPGPALVRLNAAILRGEPVEAGRAPTSAQRVDSARHEVSAATRPSEPAVSAIGLRAAPNPLLGRDADLDALENLVGTSRVTTVLGPGGTGKTRVANELGLRVAAELPVVLVELASVRAAADTARAELEGAIGATLGIGEIARDTTALRAGRKIDSRRRLRDALSARPMLLILDNCEHLIDAAAEVVADLIGACDQLRVLTTSRAPLAITAETVYPLPPLAIDEHGSPATDLFAARARAVRPSVRLDTEVVARLCRTLDGLPLAIELAAARVRTMGVEEIEKRLEHRFSLLRSGDRTSPERHRTLHAVIEWSWNLLDEPQRIALRRLCRFPAGFTLAAAEFVVGGADVDDVVTAVEGLVSQSLLTVLEDDSGTRYRMLETVREFGEEQLTAAGEADEVMLRMVGWARDFVADISRRYTSGGQLEAVLAVGAELDNLTTVLRYAVDHRDAETVYTLFPVLGLVWVMRGTHMELAGWGQRVLTVAPPATTPHGIEADLRAWTYVMLGSQAMVNDIPLRDFARVRTWARQLLHSDTPLTPSVRFATELLVTEPTPMRVLRKITEGVRSPDRATRWSALLLRANLRENASDVTGSLRDSLQALEEADLADIWGRAMVSQHLGQLGAQTGQYREAADHYRRAVHGLYLLRSYDESVELRSYLAAALIGAGELDRARQELEIAAGYVDGGARPDDPVLRPNHRRAAVQHSWAELALAEGDIDRGLQRSRRVLELFSWPMRTSSPGPGDIMTAAGVLDAHVLHGGIDQVPELPQELIETTAERLGQFFDLPQIGAVATAIGSYLLAEQKFPDIARELLALAAKVVAREDTPSMQLHRHLVLHGAATSEELMAGPRQRAARIGRRTAGKRILKLLREISGRMHE